MQKMASEREYNSFFFLENVGTTTCCEQLMEICLQSNFKLLRSAEVTGIYQHKSVFVNKAMH